MRRSGTAAFGMGLTLVLVLGACGGGAQDKVRAASAPPDNGKRDAVAWGKEWARVDEFGDSAAGDGTVSERKAAADDSLAYTASPAIPPGTESVDAVAPVETAPVPPVDTALAAGSTDDNEKWEEYLRYREKSALAGIDVHDVDVSTREVVHVVDADGKPVLGAHVELRGSDDKVLATRTTYADGRALFFPPKQSGQDAAPKYQLRASVGDAHVDQELDPETHDHTLQLDAPAVRADDVALDVQFLLDATGSMGDEIEQLKANMVSVAKQIDELSPRPNVRFGMTVFRDRGDEFVTRTFDFTADVDAFTTALRAVVANGGGDTPESVNAGLHDALTGSHWRGDDAIKLVFLVGDAAPHLDYTDDADYAIEMDVAAQRGIKIHPIASSGLENQGEYVFRQLAQYTTGRFNFLTYGADGHSPGTSTVHHVEDYSVLSLDALVVRLVQDEIDALAR